MLLKEYEDAKRVYEKENANLVSCLEEMRNQLEDTEAMLTKERQDAQDMKLHFEETQNLLMKEREDAHRMVEEGNARLEEMKAQFDEKTAELLRCDDPKSQYDHHETTAFLVKQGHDDHLEEEQEKTVTERVPIIHEVPVIDDEILLKLRAENEQLRELIKQYEKEEGGMEKMAKKVVSDHEVDSNNSDKEEEEEEKEDANSMIHHQQELLLLEKLRAENAQLKTSLSKEREIMEKVIKEMNKIEEGVPPSIDHELLGKLTAENEQLKVMLNECGEAEKTQQGVRGVIDVELLNNQELKLENEKLKAMLKLKERDEITTIKDESNQKHVHEECGVDTNHQQLDKVEDRVDEEQGLVTDAASVINQDSKDNLIGENEKLKVCTYLTMHFFKSVSLKYYFLLMIFKCSSSH